MQAVTKLSIMYCVYFRQETNVGFTKPYNVIQKLMLVFIGNMCTIMLYSIGIKNKFIIFVVALLGRFMVAKLAVKMVGCFRGLFEV